MPEQCRTLLYIYKVPKDDSKLFEKLILCVLYGHLLGMSCNSPFKFVSCYTSLIPFLAFAYTSFLLDVFMMWKSILSVPGVCFTKVFRTELGHKYILVECSVIALCLPVVSKLSRYKLVCYYRTMIGMSIKRISVLNLCHVLKPFVKSTPGHCYFICV